MRLKESWDIEWQDLARIESPFFAQSKVKKAFKGTAPTHIRGLDEVLQNDVHEFSCPAHDGSDLARVLSMLERGDIFLVHDPGDKPFSPVVRWEEDGDGGRWEITLKDASLYALSSLEWLIDKLTSENGGAPAGDSAWWDEAVGGAKEIVNQLGRRAAAGLSESTGIRYVEKDTGREIDLNEAGRELLPPGNAAQARGAQAVRDHQASAALVSTIMALASKFRSVVRDPETFAADLKEALTNTRSEGEAMGKVGLIQGKRRVEHETAEGYGDRYHGPDDITRAKKDSQLAEWEAKGSKTDSTAVAKDKHGNRQGSTEKNRLRAELMVTDKARKIGQPSNRQGGPYTQEEIDLWQEIAHKRGKKQHISVHTNTETGMVRIYERDEKGVIDKKLDEFKMENFEAMKQAIREAFKK